MNPSTDKVMFFSKVQLPDENGCMKWLGRPGSAGYGKAQLSRRSSSGLPRTHDAHRLSYRIFYGEPAPGNVVMHSCDNKWCVAPNHLSEGSQQENIDDMITKGRANFLKPRRTHCKKGHLYTQESTYTSPAGARSCKICRRSRERKGNE